LRRRWLELIEVLLGPYSKEVSLSSGGGCRATVR
jgi:hypothetical protein